MPQLPSPIPPTELDAWPKAERLLAAGLTLHEVLSGISVPWLATSSRQLVDNDTILPGKPLL